MESVLEPRRAPSAGRALSGLRTRRRAAPDHAFGGALTLGPVEGPTYYLAADGAFLVAAAALMEAAAAPVAAGLAAVLILGVHLVRRGRRRSHAADPVRAPRETDELLDRIIEGHLAVDREWRIARINLPAAAHLGRERDELLGAVLWDAFPDLVGTRVYQECYRAMADGVPIEFEAESALRPRHTLRIRIHPASAGLEILFEDLTERLREVTALRERDGRLQALLKNVLDLVALVDLDRRVRFVGPSVERVLGHPPERLVGSALREWVHPDDLSRADELFEQAILSPGRVHEDEFRILAGDGTWRLFEFATRNLLDNPVVRGVALSGRDVTARADAERALRVTEQRYRALFEGAPVGLFHATPEGDLVDVNGALVEILGYPDRETLIGTNLLELHARREDRRRWIDRLEAEPVLRDFETRLRRPDGSVITVKLNIRADRDASGRTLRYEGALEDITDRLRAEAAARRSHELFQLVQRATHDPLYDWEFATDRVYWNEAIRDVLGYSVDEVDPERAWWIDRIHPDDRDRVVSRQEAAITGSAEASADEYRFLRADGDYATLLDRRYIVRDEDGVPTRMIGVLVDVTRQRRAEEERKRLEEQLLEAQKLEAVGRLAGGVAHDFNNLLTAIQGHAEVLAEVVAEDGPARADLDQIRRAAERAARLTNQLLTFSRRQVLQPRILDLDAVIRDLAPMLRRLIGEDIALHVDTAAAHGYVKADPGQIEQVIMNLVVNARDAMPNGGRLGIGTRIVRVGEDEARQNAHTRPGEYVLLVITDTGTGMDPETQARIFEPFFTTKELGKGTGLGLSTVYGIVQQSGGFIEVESRTGRGTSFSVYLPRAEGEPEGGAATGGCDPHGSGAAADGAPVGHETVLLVEDEPAVRELVRKVLQRQGYTVLVAADGAEAIRLAETRREPIQLLLTDVIMPEMSGRELAERLIAARPGLRVLFISGYTEDIMASGLPDARVDLLEKPFSPTVLARKVREVLDS